MFELLLAKKYLIPKRKQLSVSLIASLSVGVISLVVWLVLVFLSITDGIEKRWLEKLTALNAPIRLIPTPAYYSSYYYQIDKISSQSHYMPKSIGEKARTKLEDPHLLEVDEAVPPEWPTPDRDATGQLKDIVKLTYQALRSLQPHIPGFVFQDFEVGAALMRIDLSSPSDGSQQTLSQMTYVASLADKNPYLASLLVPPPKLSKEGSTPPLSSSIKGSGVLLAKNFQDNGVRIGDRGTLAYQGLSTGSMQEQRLPIFVSGFYDPGVFPIGNKCILAPMSLAHTLLSSHGELNVDPTLSNGIQLWFSSIDHTANVKAKVQQALEQAGISSYWKMTTFREYDFARDLLQQFQSDKLLFLFVGIIILLVACCNIISLLVLLVNDKKREIAILHSLGASSRSIAFIFACCGTAVGVLSSLIGTLAALITLHYIDAIVGFLSFLQGHETFSATFYGNSLPNSLSGAALAFALTATSLISLCAGLIPALKACRLSPSAVLRST